MGNTLSGFNFVLFLGHADLAARLTKDHCVLEPSWTKPSWRWGFSWTLLANHTSSLVWSKGGVIIPKSYVNHKKVADVVWVQ